MILKKRSSLPINLGRVRRPTFYSEKDYIRQTLKIVANIPISGNIPSCSAQGLSRDCAKLEKTAKNKQKQPNKSHISATGPGHLALIKSMVNSSVHQM